MELLAQPILPLRRARATVKCSSSSSGRLSFIKDVAATEPPKHLHRLLKVLQTRGFVLKKMPIHRRVSDDYHASSEAGKELYNKGDFAKSQVKNLEAYLLKKVGMFPDVLERKVNRQFDDGDEKYFTFGRVGRALEAKDAARVALKSPWWTLGYAYEREDELLEYIKEVSEEGKQEDVKKGMAPAQVSLDEAEAGLNPSSFCTGFGNTPTRITTSFINTTKP